VALAEPMPAQGGRFRPGLLVLAGLAAGAVTGAAVLRRLDAVEVAGLSMAPSLLPGDRLLAESWTYARRPPRPGEVIVAPDPRGGRELIKRVAAVRDGTIDLRGDRHASSTDSRHFGAVPASSVRWRVTLRYWPPARFGRVPVAPAPLQVEPQGGEPACTAFEDLVVGAETGE
jgi:nickel-type superoxide dismutase maturation protease